MALGRDGPARACAEGTARRPRARGARGRLLRVVDPRRAVQRGTQGPSTSRGVETQSDRQTDKQQQHRSAAAGRRRNQGRTSVPSRRSSGAAASILKQKPTTNAGSRHAGAAPPVHPMIVTRPTTTAPSPFGETRRTSAGRRSRASSTRSSRRGRCPIAICGPSPCCSPTTSASTSPWTTRAHSRRSLVSGFKRGGRDAESRRCPPARCFV